MEFRFIPRARDQKVLERRYRDADILIAQVERGQPKAHDIGRPEVSDDLARNQGLHYRMSMWVPESHMAAARHAFRRAHELDPKTCATLFDLLDQDLRQSARLLRNERHVGLEERVHSCFERTEAQDRRRAAQKLSD